MKQKTKEVKKMEPVSLIFTICGAATLAGGIMKAVEKMEK